jgi:cytosine/adenosine deaminase-related metal-dependent hydrolase
MSIESAITAYDHHHGSFDDKLHVWMAAGTPRGSHSSAHKAIGDACRKHDIGLTMHCAEAPKDLEIYRDSYHCTPVEFCRDTNLISRKTVLAYMVHLDLDVDLQILSEGGTTVAHNPTSNCKLASGIARVPEMVAGSVDVSLGTDGAPRSNTYDMFREMHLAGILHKGANHDASLVGATEVLEMATINGALALGLQDDIGSLEVGKKADLVVVDPSRLHAARFDAAQDWT